MEYFVCIQKQDEDFLAKIRHWINIKMAFEGDFIWIKDLSTEQIQSFEIKTIPSHILYYAQNGKLFLHNSLLPNRNIPALLWTPIERALPVKLPAFNHNYFGTKEKININLIVSYIENEAFAMVTTISILDEYIQTAPKIRLQNISWALAEEDKLILFGQPILPIRGEILWRNKDFLIPAGYDFELHLLADQLNDMINPKKDAWVVWDTDGNYFLIPKQISKPLSLSSFRLSVSNKRVDFIKNS